MITDLIFIFCIIIKGFKNKQIKTESCLSFDPLGSFRETKISTKYTELELLHGKSELTYSNKNVVENYKLAK